MHCVTRLPWITIRNLDSEIYRRLKAHAALSGTTIGEAVHEALRAYLDSPRRSIPGESLADWQPESFPPGNERLSEEIDRLVYGASQPVEPPDTVQERGKNET